MSDPKNFQTELNLCYIAAVYAENPMTDKLYTQAQLERKAREVAEKWIKPEPFVPPANWRNATAAQIPPTVITLTNKPYEDVIKELTSLIAAALGEAVDEAVAGAFEAAAQHSPKLYFADGPVTMVNQSASIAWIGCTCGWNDKDTLANWSQHIRTLTPPASQAALLRRDEQVREEHGKRT